MPGSDKGNYWSVSALKRRGWTDGMMRALLPPPRYINPPSAPRGIRVWKKSDVLRAERSPEFGELRARPRRAGGESRDPWKDAKLVGELLSRAWKAAERDGSPAWRLAEHYHRAISSRVLAAMRGKGLYTSQATAWLNEFLAMERHCDGRRLRETLKNFVRALNWLAENPQHTLTGRVGERFSGSVSWIDTMGAFVRLDETGAEGLVRLSALGGDEWWDLDEDLYVLQGASSGRTISLGTRVIVEVSGTDAVRGHLDFKLIHLGRALH